MTKQIGVFIGRFQPPHKIHKRIINEAIDKYDHLIIIIGSKNSTLSLKNPFDDETRLKMIWKIIGVDNSYKASVRFARDSNYNFEKWIRDIDQIVTFWCIDNLRGDEPFKINLIGHFKDSGSYWLNHFPQWNLDQVDYKSTINSTNIRRAFFHKSELLNMNDVSPEILQVMLEWKNDNKDLYLQFQQEAQFILDYKKQWNSVPYPVTFTTVDTMVLCKGHILLIRRKRQPGKNLLALPGGFIDEFEFLEDAAIRELKEETRIDIDTTILKNSIKKVKVIDNPYRDPRGRFITHVHLIKLNVKNLPIVRASDDAKEVIWMTLGSIDMRSDEFFADHYQIIRSLI